ncbi:MAG: lytic transglycosylase domain-containing protein [Beijerinckiaceae bacterium]|nr:lytic transglycosylase domain-containing protein [Beijerinckiaceae bacterium]
MTFNTTTLSLGLLAGMIVCAPMATASTEGNGSQNHAIDQKIARHAQANGVPVPLARAVIRLESNFRPGAANKGNYGLMQIRLGTARSLGYRGGAAGLLDANTNLTYGMKYLAQAYRLAGGDTCGTIMRYQSGHRATRASSANRAYCGRAKVLMARAN